MLHQPGLAAGKSPAMLSGTCRVAKLRPGLPVLFTTGYTRNAIVKHGRLDPDVDLIAKPFSIDQLARKIRQMLDEG